MDISILENWLWDAACSIRGPIDAPKFKKILQEETSGGFQVTFCRDIFTEENLRKMGLNERQIKAVLYVKERGKITNREYQKAFRVSKATATRDLTDLVEKDIFKVKGMGKREIHYFLVSQK